MEAKLKDKKPVEATVEVTVPAAEVDKTFDKVLRQLARQVKVPGFRPGKAPRGVLVKRVGKEALEGEVREELIESSYQKALEQFELVPLHAHVHGGAPSEGQDFTFELHVDLYPEVVLGDLDELVIDSEGRKVDDEMVAATVARLQSENATMVPVDRPAEAGDYLLVEMADSDDSEGGGSTMPIDLESVGDELAEQLIGRSAGELVTLRLAQPPAADSAEAAGGETDSDTPSAEADAAGGDAGDSEEGSSTGEQVAPTLDVRIKDVKAKEKPAADDEFAKTLGFDDWQETEARIRESLQAQLDEEVFEEQREEFVEKLMAGTTFELPRSLVQRRRGGLLENLTDDLKRRGMTLESYVGRLDENGGREEFERELQEAAEKGVRRDLVLERLLEQRGTRLSDAEFEASLSQLANQQGMDVDRLRRERGDDWLRNYRFLLTRDRALRETVAERLAAQNGPSGEVGTAAGDVAPEDAEAPAPEQDASGS
ncbi:MAG: trigger factor [Trueperaceae bacterium]